MPEHKITSPEALRAITGGSGFVFQHRREEAPRRDVQLGEEHGARDHEAALRDVR